jgi:hypothetical protein
LREIFGTDIILLLVEDNLNHEEHEDYPREKPIKDTIEILRARKKPDEEN